MTKEEIEAAQKVIDAPVTPENIDEPLEAVLPAPPQTTEQEES